MNAQHREQSKISCCPFLSKSYLLLIILSQGQLMPSYFIMCPKNLPWQPSSWGTPKYGQKEMWASVHICRYIWLDRHVCQTPFLTSVLMIVSRPQWNCPSLSSDYLWEWFWLLGGWYLLYLLWGHLLHPPGCSIMPGIFTSCPNWNLTRYLKGFFLKVSIALLSKVSQIGSWHSEPGKKFLF